MIGKIASPLIGRASSNGVVVGMVGGVMSDDILVHSGDLKIRVHCIDDDIDEDDRDALRVVIEVTNEGVSEVTGIDAKMRTMDGGKVEAFESAPTIPVGMRQDYSYFVSADSGAWLFKIDFNSGDGVQKAELGPHSCDVRIAETFRKPVNTEGKGSAVGGSIFEAAFDSALTGFGDEIEPMVAAAAAPNEANPLASAFSTEIPVAPSVEVEISFMEAITITTIAMLLIAKRNRSMA